MFDCEYFIQNCSLQQFFPTLYSKFLYTQSILLNFSCYFVQFFKAFQNFKQLSPMQFSKNEIKKAIKNQNRLHYIIFIRYSSNSSYYAKKSFSFINCKSTSPRIICPSGRRCTRSGKRGRAKAKGLKHRIPFFKRINSKF